MSAGCEWCGKHRESLVKVSDNINDLHRGARALVEIALTDGNRIRRADRQGITAALRRRVYKTCHSRFRRSIGSKLP